MNKILVTGGYGLVGSEFKSDEYYRLSSKETDLRIGKDVDLLLSENKFDGVIHSTTDDYFLNNNDKFDLIYIDALHEKNQVYKDFKNSFNSLNDSGIIIFHDINPISIGQTDFTSSGDIFELWIEISKKYKVYVFNGLDGDTVGIFLKNKNPKFIDVEIKKHTYEFFSENREDFISYINYEEIINKMKK